MHRLRAAYHCARSLGIIPPPQHTTAASYTPLATATVTATSYTPLATATVTATCTHTRARIHACVAYCQLLLSMCEYVCVYVCVCVWLTTAQLGMLDRYHKDCYGMFEEHNVKATLQSIIDSYPQNAVSSSQATHSVSGLNPFHKKHGNILIAIRAWIFPQVIRHHGMQAMKSVYHSIGDGQNGHGIVDTNARTVFKTILIGCTNVGKTCIVLRACRNEFSSRVKATLGVRASCVCVHSTPLHSTALLSRLFSF